MSEKTPQSISQPESNVAPKSRDNGRWPSSVRRALASTHNVIVLIVVVGCILAGLFTAGLFSTYRALDTAPTLVPHLRMNGDERVRDPLQMISRLTHADRSVGQVDRDPGRPLWLLSQLSESKLTSSEPVTLELRLLRSANYQFWLMPVDRTRPPIEATDLVRETQNGLGVTIPAQKFKYDVLGAVTTTFLWKPKIRAWQGMEPNKLDENFSSRGAVLYTVFLTLAFFSAGVALVNKSALFWIFTAWLIASLRIAGFNNAWDFQWLGIPFYATEFEIQLMRISLTAYALLTTALFSRLFAGELQGTIVKLILSASTLAFGLLIVFAPFLAQAVYMQMFWVGAVSALLAMGAGLVLTLKRSPTVTAYLYMASYGLMILGMLSEILYQANVTALAPTFIDATSGAIASAVVMSITLAAQLRRERNKRVQSRRNELIALRELEGVYRRTPVGLFRLRSDGSFRFANAAFKELFNSEGNQTSMAEVDVFRAAALEELGDRHAMTQREIAIEELWYSVNLSHTADGGYDGSVFDISERKNARKAVDYLARHDPETGALNRRAFSALVSGQWDSGEPPKGALAMFSLDRYALLVKTHGLTFGDSVLSKIVAETHEALSGCSIGRIHDAIYVFAPRMGTQSLNNGLTILFHKLQHSRLAIENVEVTATFTCGIGALASASSDENAFTRVAVTHDLAAKRGGGVIIDSAQERIEILEELDSLSIAGGLPRILEEGRFFMVVQPIVRLQGSGAISYELLMRMRGNDNKPISPGQFIPAAEQMGTMPMLDRFAFQEALRILSDGSLNGVSIDYLSINISGTSLNDASFLSEIYELALKASADLTHLCCEVTETTAIDNFERTRVFLDALRQLGVRTAIDDYGAGHNSINYLTSLRPDYLKLDGHLIVDILTNPVHKSYVEKMVQLAYEMNIQCVAEYIETQECADAVKAIGVTFGQGYFYSEPVAIEVLPILTTELSKRVAVSVAENKNFKLVKEVLPTGAKK